MGLVHLHRHSEYSLLDGTGNAQQYAQRAAALGQDSLALTDHGTLSGALHHIVACEEAGIKPIVGVEAYYRPNRLIHNNDNKRTFHMVLLALNFEGWQNLLRLTSEAYRPESFYYKPCIDFDLLRKYSGGLFMSTACIAGYLNNYIERGDDTGLADYVREVDAIFGDNWALEMMPNSLDQQKLLNLEIVNIANQYGRSIIATVDAHYPYKEWADTQDIVLMMATGQSQLKRQKKKDAGEDVYTFGEKSLYLMSEDEIKEAFQDKHPLLPAHVVDDAIKNTQLIADYIEPFKIDKSTKMPKFTPKHGMDAKRIVRMWAEEGLEEIEIRYRMYSRGDEWDEQLGKVYRDQLEYEFGVLDELGVFDYFAIVGGMVRAAKAKPMRVGAGRGSACGSLVSFCIKMTGLDPIGHGLMFERFINPHRREMPDVDSDFPRADRQWVKDWVGQEIGVDNVADIVAFQTFAHKAALSGVARVFDIPFEDRKKINKVLDGVEGDHTLEEIAETFPEIASFRDRYPEVWKHALRISDPPMVKALSKHPGGVVITDRPVSEYMPTMRGNKGDVVTAWGARTQFNVIDRYGFVKIDILGIADLDKQQYALDLIKKHKGIDIDLNELPACFWPDVVEPEVMLRFQQGDTFGVFQFEGRDITGMLKGVRPETLNDVTALNAGWRPGGIQSGAVFELGPRKNGTQAWTHWHPSVAPILDETYGLVLYQEQVIRVVQVLGEFTLAEGDIVRKSITKNYQTTGAKDLEAYRAKFLENAGAKVGDKQARFIWEQLMKFTKYGFNKAHAAGYATMAYQDMWLKVHYPHEFYCSQMTYEEKKVPRAIREAQASGIKILPPDINSSEATFTLDGDSIRFGLAAVNNVGEKAVEAIKRYRPFASYEDFEARVPKRECTSRVKQALINVGAFDAFDMRAFMTSAERAQLEREGIGFSLTSNPIAQHRDLIRSRIISEAEFDNVLARPKSHKRYCTCDVCEESEVSVGGEIIGVKRINTKSGSQMAFVDVAFGSDTYACTMFQESLDQYGHLLDGAVLVKGKKDDRGQIVVDYMCSVDALAEALRDKEATD